MSTSKQNFTFVTSQFIQNTILSSKTVLQANRNWKCDRFPPDISRMKVLLRAQDDCTQTFYETEKDFIVSCNSTTDEQFVSTLNSR